MKLRCVSIEYPGEVWITEGEVYNVEETSYGYALVGDCGVRYDFNMNRLELNSFPQGGKFEIVEDPGNNQREPEDLQMELPSLEQLSEWCQKAEVDVTMTSFGTFNVFDGDTERQCEIKDAENLVQLLQIMVSYKESLEIFGRWV